MLLATCVLPMQSQIPYNKAVEVVGRRPIDYHIPTMPLSDLWFLSFSSIVLPRRVLLEFSILYREAIEFGLDVA